MAQVYTAQIQHRGEWWIGWIREIAGITCQGRTREELLETLRITLLEVLEYDSQEAVCQSESEYEVVKIAIMESIPWMEQKQDPTTGKNSTAQRLIETMEKPPYLTDEDVDALHQSIEEGKIPIKFDSPFESDEREQK